MQIIDTGYDSEDQSIMFTSSEWNNNASNVFTKQIVLQNRTWKINYKFNGCSNQSEIIILHKQNKRIAKQINASLPEQAHSFRLGGDEFCILAPLTKIQLPHYLQMLQTTALHF